ncbi:B-cell receptor CD22-like isoform X1 [Pygocentrus nattereri]|uniref:B-cell receptor CD22-like isoform X1 n=1 Tax=Pygocentrus nattereri TaxID=42514 RepID=UPI0018919D12|nr:B-cell receptor CD22-like isoform X1 [Pygocentrus nattereri]
MRSLRTAPPLPLVFLLMTAGAFATEWSVKYNQQEICALKGSTVFMNGTFTHPEGLTVKEIFWVIDPALNPSWPDMSQNPDYSGRVEYLGDEQKLVSLKLSDVMKKDEHEYCVRIKTDQEMQKYFGRPGVRLTVTELHVKAPEEVTEGETADLTCMTTCNLTDPTFIWYKNGWPLTTKTIKNNQLHLQTVSSEDAGSYSCAVGGSQHLRSTAHSLRVRYPPKSVSVSISPSGEIVEGSSVTLTCSSNGNPPVKNYTWFKEGGTSSVGSGQNYSIISITADHTGLYYCEAENEHGAERSDGVLVFFKVLYTGYPLILYVAVGVGVCMITVFLTVVLWRRSSESRRKRQDRNTDQTIYSNEGQTDHSAHPPPEDESSVYTNVAVFKKQR